MQRLVLMRDTPLDAVSNTAVELGWIHRDLSADSLSEVIAEYGLTPTVRAPLVEDSQSGWTYLLVPDAHTSEWREGLNKRNLLVWRDDALTRHRNAQNLDALRDATLLLGLFAYGPFDKEVFAALAAALLSSSDAVRSDAMTAITYSQWPEFGPLLRAGLDEVNVSPQLQQEGREIADRMDAEGWNRSYYASDP